MTEQQRLRETLQVAVPEPPTEPGRARSARHQATLARRRRLAALVTVAAVVILGAWGASAMNGTDERPIIAGSGETACRQLARETDIGRYVDNRLVDGRTVADWLRRVNPKIDPGPYQHEDRVTVCLTSHGTYLFSRSGEPEHVSFDDYAMTTLDRLWTGGRSTTNAPFNCDGPPTERYPDVTTTLPSGATAARICFDGEFLTPSQTLTQNVETLVHEVNAAPIEYSAPDFICSGAGGDYGFTIVFRYPSGTRSVSEETCRGLALGPYTRAARVSLDPLYLSLLARQVGASPGSVAAPPCRASDSDRPEGVGDIRNIIAARYCPSRAGEPGLGLDGSQLRQLRSWGRSYLGATTEPDDPAGRCSRPAAGWPRLSLADAWGDHFTVVLVGCSPRLFPAAVNWGAPDKVIYPLAVQTVAHLARELAGGSG